VLVEYLIPLKHTATTRGEHVFFDIDVKGGEKEWFGPDATVGGPNRLAQSFRVAINAKGGDCWHVYKKSVLIIDGKNNNNDGMSTGKNNNNDSMLIVIEGKNNNDEGMVTGKNSSDVGRFTVGRQQWKTSRQGRSAAMMAWKDQKRNNEEQP
jgi:hypothetical protein